MKKNLIFSIILFTNLILIAQGNIINVPGNYEKIQDAINSSTDGDTIIVAPGTYNENVNFIGKNIVLTSNYLFENDATFISSTIIDGSTPQIIDTASVVLFVNEENNSAVLQGFTITGGKGTKTFNTDEGLYFRTGGGILIDHASPTIIHNIITNNESTNLSDVNGAGGGGLRAGQSKAVINNNIISNNKGGYAGGIMLAFCLGMELNNNIITNNEAFGDFDGGGGIYVDKRSVTITNNTIVNNHSGGKGGGLIITGTFARINNCIIYGNTSDQSDPQIFKRFNGNALISNTNIEGGWSGDENMDENPKFSDTTSYMLKDNSPCIDGGKIATEFNDPKSSTVGEALFPSKGTIRNDMGAYGGPNRSILINTVTDIDDSNIKLTDNFNLYQNYPNPFNPTTTISYNIPHSKQFNNKLQNVSLKVYDVLGKEVETLVNEANLAGSYQVQFDANNLTSGVYYYQLRMGSFVETKKLLLVK